MKIEHEIRNFLLTNLKENSEKLRDIELIFYYYGLRDDPWPTLEDAALKFKVGEEKPKKRRAERPRQIISRKFKKLVGIKDLPSLEEFANKIASSSIHDSKQLISFANETNLFDRGEKLVPIIRILNDLGLCKDYGIYTATLNPLTKGTYRDNGNELLIAQKPRITQLRKYWVIILSGG